MPAAFAIGGGRRRARPAVGATTRPRRDLVAWSVPINRCSPLGVVDARRQRTLSLARCRTRALGGVGRGGARVCRLRGVARGPARTRIWPRNRFLSHTRRATYLQSTVGSYSSVLGSELGAPARIGWAP